MRALKILLSPITLMAFFAAIASLTFILMSKSHWDINVPGVNRFVMLKHDVVGKTTCGNQERVLHEAGFYQLPPSCEPIEFWQEVRLPAQEYINNGYQHGKERVQ